MEVYYTTSCQHFSLKAFFVFRRVKMKKELIFENVEFGKLTIIEKNGKPWFVGKEIAETLGYQNPQKAIRDHCKGVNEMDLPTSGGIQTKNIIPEPDLYRLIMRSKLPAIERFQDWVVEEVLPSIRKTGSYSTISVPKTEKYEVAKSHVDLELFVQRYLRTSEASQLGIIHAVYEEHGVSTKLLPVYTRDVKVTFSATDLLKKYDYKVSAKAFNVRMIKHGYMENKERTSRGAIKTFKALTSKGLEYGQNDTSKHNPRETQPHYFEDSFKELFELIAI